MDRLRNAVPTLSDLFRKEAHGCFAVRISGGWFSQPRSTHYTFPPTRSLTRTAPSSGRRA